MSPARRSIKRRDWPRGLQERRPGYFSWVHPDGRELPIGRVPLAVAKNEAAAANQHVMAQRPGLIERITGESNKVAQLLEQMPAANKPNTAKMHRSIDKLIEAKLGDVMCLDLSVLQCAELIEGIRSEGKERMAQAVRSRLIAVCKRGMQLGWMESNPAEVTANPQVIVKRERLTLESFNAILAVADKVAEWLPRAMLLGIGTAQDPSTLAAAKRADVRDGCLVVNRSKTEGYNQPIAIPVELRLDAIGRSLGDLLRERTGVVSPYLVHHVRPYGNAPSGAAVHPDTISRSFTEARALAGIPDVLPNGKTAPTFHEIRSLALRLYKKQGNVDTKALAQHSQDKTHALYQDPRGIEAVRVRVV